MLPVVRSVVYCELVAGCWYLFVTRCVLFVVNRVCVSCCVLCVCSSLRVACLVSVVCSLCVRLFDWLFV